VLEGGEIMFCPNCGHKVEGVEKFCPQCGAPLGGVARVKKGGSSRWLKITGIVGGVVLVILIAALLIGRVSPHASPEAVVSGFLTALVEEFDASQLLEVIDPQALAQLQRKAGVGMDEIREAAQAGLDAEHGEMKRRGASISFAVGRTELQNGRAETEVRLRMSHPVEGDEEVNITLATVERDGRWYIYILDNEPIVDWLLQEVLR
jgi:hypothetical protein